MGGGRDEVCEKVAVRGAQRGERRSIERKERNRENIQGMHERMRQGR